MGCHLTWSSYQIAAVTKPSIGKSLAQTPKRPGQQACWEAGMRRGVPSKSHSCSEMVEGHRKLIAAKMERDSPSTMERKIQEISFVLECSCDKANAMTDHRN